VAWASGKPFMAISPPSGIFSNRVFGKAFRYVAKKRAPPSGGSQLASVLRCSESRRADGDPRRSLSPVVGDISPLPLQIQFLPPPAPWALWWRGPVVNPRRWVLDAAGAWPVKLSLVLGTESVGGTLGGDPSADAQPWGAPMCSRSGSPRGAPSGD